VVNTILNLRGRSAHALQMGVSIGVRGRRVPGPIVLLAVLDDIVLMAVRQKTVKFADIVVIQFQFLLVSPPFMAGVCFHLLPFLLVSIVVFL
jgi:hypothetical protein